MSAHGEAPALRPVMPADAAFLYRLFSSLKTDELAAGDWPAPLREQVLRQQFQAHEQHYRTALAGTDDELICLGEKPVGRLMVRRTAKAVHLADISLLPEYRNAGIGAALIRQLQAEAGSSDRPVRLQVMKTSAAVRLYGRLGFVPVADTDTHWLMEWAAAG